jgi:hypothetical protein
MDTQSMLNIAFAVAGSLGGWWLRVMWEATVELKRDLSELERTVSQSYVRRDDYKDDIAEIKLILREIFNKLDSKADKG